VYSRLSHREENSGGFPIGGVYCRLSYREEGLSDHSAGRSVQRVILQRIAYSRLY
jgi:hypothetical protein